jgi:amino acid transporter
MEISTVGRPRNVGWLRAAALLYGDWGTSKAYVVGIGLAVMGAAALPHLLAVCALTALVGINYIFVCKYFPTGGGVYTAARAHSHRLAAIGALLLIADYIVTASLSCLEAFHYFGFEGFEAKKWAITAIFAVGVINFFGPKHTGKLAIYLAIPTVVVVIALVVSGIRFLPDFHTEPMRGGVMTNWAAFVGMILALSGVEAAANTTGVMRLDPGSTPQKPSVLRTARKAVLVVMIEVVLGTAALSVLAFCIGPVQPGYSEALLRVMAEKFIGNWFGIVTGVVFGLLLLSAVNTAINGLVAVFYMMAHDRELPEPFTQLNGFGVPWLALIFATVLPVIVLNVDDSVEGLAALYAIGVVGAIAINLGSCAINKELPMKRYERVLMGGTFVILVAVWITIALTKLVALGFVVAILAVGLGIREYTHRQAKKHPAPENPVEEALEDVLAETRGSKILVAARGYTKALEFALQEAALRQAKLFVLYIREVAVQAETNGDWRQDPQARELFTRLLQENPDLTLRPMYSVSDVPADTILDIVGVVGAKILVLGGSKRAKLVNLLKGNVITQVAEHLPEDTQLIVVA